MILLQYDNPLTTKFFAGIALEPCKLIAGLGWKFPVSVNHLQ